MNKSSFDSNDQNTFIIHHNTARVKMNSDIKDDDSGRPKLGSIDYSDKYNDFYQTQNERSFKRKKRE